MWKNIVVQPELDMLEAHTETRKKTKEHQISSAIVYLTQNIKKSDMIHCNPNASSCRLPR